MSTAASSTVTSTVVTATCPAAVLGSLYVWFAPNATSQSYATASSVTTAYNTYLASVNSATYNSSTAYLSV